MDVFTVVEAGGDYGYFWHFFVLRVGVQNVSFCGRNPVNHAYLVWVFSPLLRMTTAQADFSPSLNTEYKSLVVCISFSLSDCAMGLFAIEKYLVYVVESFS